MKYNKCMKLSKLGIALAVAMGSSVSTMTVAAENKKIEVIEVTAQKRSQSINEVPMAISAFNAEGMDEMGIEDTADLATVIPGFNFSDTAFGPPVYTLRGVGFNESSAQATSTVGVYIDEISIPFPIMTKAAQLDLERVEVLKGPQGTLYGRNATAGAVNYIAAKPTDDFEAAIKGSYGNFDTFKAEGFVSGGLTDSVNGRIALKTVSSAKGWQESVTRDDTLGEQDKIAARLSLAFDLGAGTNALFTVSYSSDSSDSIAPQAIRFDYGNAGRTTPITQATFNEQTFTGNTGESNKADWTGGRTPSVDHKNSSFALTFNHDINDTMTFTSLTGYSDFKDSGSEYERGGVQGNLRNTVEGWALGDNATLADDEYVTTDYVYQNGDINSFSQEFRITETLDSMVWIAGVYYSDSEVDYITTQDWGVSSNVNIAPVTGLGFNFANNESHQKTTTLAVYANADWFINDELTITTGLRYSDDKAEYTGCTRDVDGGGAATFGRFFFGDVTALDPGTCITVKDFGTPEQSAGEVSDELNEDSLSWRLAGNYKFNDDISGYASYSRGFKAGSFPSLATVAENQLEPVVQEQLDAYEIGLKSTLAEGEAQLNTSVFYYDYKDKQLLTKTIVPVFGTAFTLDNMDKSTVKGIEVDLLWLPTDNLTVSTAVGWLDTEIKTGSGFNQLGQELNFAGSDLPFSSKLQANITAKYEWEINSDVLAMVAFDASWSGDTYHDFQSKDAEPLNMPGVPYEFDKEFIEDGYTLINGRIGLFDADGLWKTYLWVRNLTDEHYATTTVKNNEMISRYSNMPRTFGISVEYNFF